MSTLDAENYSPEEVAIAAAVEGPTFDDLVTGEIPTHGARVAATPKAPDPVPVGSAVAFGFVPRLVPRRHVRRDRVSVTLWRMAAGVAAAVVGDVALVVGFLAGLEAVGGMR